MIFSPHGLHRGGVFCLAMTPQQWTVGDAGPYNGNKNFEQQWQPLSCAFNDEIKTH